MPISVPDPEPECRVDGDCPSRMACLQEVCRNPCTTLNPCGINADCTVQNTLPQRTMICMCRPGYVGDADVACNLRKYLITKDYISKIGYYDNQNVNTLFGASGCATAKLSVVLPIGVRTTFLTIQAFTS